MPHLGGGRIEIWRGKKKFVMVRWSEVGRDFKCEWDFTRSWRWMVNSDFGERKMKAEKIETSVVKLDTRDESS